MESDILQPPQETLACFICQGMFMDPVLLRCGHIICKACLIFFTEDFGIPDHCPMCREPSHRMFSNDLTMRNLVFTVRKNRLKKYLSSEEHKCVTHKERKTEFCDESRTLLCQLCSDSQEHRGHRHCSIGIGVGMQMMKLQRQMTSLLRKIQEQQENIKTERRTIFQWLHYVTLREEMIRTEYRKLYPPLDEEENQHMECIKNQSNTILKELRKSEATMVHKRNQLIEVYQELMTLSQKPYEVVLEQDLDDLVRRSELVQLGLMPPSVKPKLSAHPNTGLTARFNCFQVKIFFQNLVIFNYNRSQFFDDRRLAYRPYYETPFLDSAVSYRASWGAESFTTGKHYWELDLKDYEQWAIGVSNNVWLEKMKCEIGSEGAFLLVCLKERDHYSLLTTCPTFLHYIEKPAGRVGVFLDCEGGCVSFLDVAKSSLIYSYCSETLRGTVRPYFSTVYT